MAAETTFRMETTCQVQMHFFFSVYGDIQKKVMCLKSSIFTITFEGRTIECRMTVGVPTIPIDACHAIETAGHDRAVLEKIAAVLKAHIADKSRVACPFCEKAVVKNGTMIEYAWADAHMFVGSDSHVSLVTTCNDCNRNFKKAIKEQRSTGSVIMFEIVRGYVLHGIDPRKQTTPPNRKRKRSNRRIDVMESK